MPKRTDISTILIIGAGPIVIGQACEFDYSGTQAVKTLKEEGYRIVLVNSNPATIMTDPELADATYIEPITPEIVGKIIEKERHVIAGGFALLPTMGGQTALNCALSLRRQGTLAKFDVEMIGATAEAIDKAEDRGRFREAMTRIGLETPRSIQTKNLPDALRALDDIGLPAIIRPSFTMGGTGGGIAYTKAEFIEIVERGIDASPTNEVLIEESVLGWKEFEMEVVRDKNDNCIIICSIENLDPMGVHTGASTTLTTSMKSVGEVMAIGRTFQESLQKALRGLETGLTGLDEIEIEGLGRGDDKNAIRAALGTPTPNRLLQVAQAMRLGWSDEDIFTSCKIDPWFLGEMRGIVRMEDRVRKGGLPANAFAMRTLKAMGFSDARLAVLAQSTEADVTAKR